MPTASKGATQVNAPKLNPTPELLALVLSQIYRRPTFFLALSLIMRMALAYLIPLSTDESYYFLWVKHLDYGYYDHPAFLAWFLYPFQIFGNSAFGFRLSTVLTYGLLIPGIAAVFMTRIGQKERSRAAFLIFSCLPQGFLPFVNHELPQVFLFLAASLSWIGLAAPQKGRPLRALACGGITGLTLLAKTTSVAFIFGSSIFLFLERKKLDWKVYLCLLVGAAPSLITLLVWNLYNCFSHLEFQILRSAYDHTNRIERHLGMTLLYFLICIGPLAIKIPETFWRKKFDAPSKFLIIQIVCLFLMGLGLSVKIHYSIHYLFGFTIFLLLFMIRNGELRSLERLAMFGALIMPTCFALGAYYSQSEIFAHTPGDTVAWYGPKERALLGTYLKKLPSPIEIAALRYDEAALGEMASQRKIWTIGNQSHRGRSYDWWDDFRSLDGKDVLIYALDRLPIEEMAAYFDSSEIQMQSLGTRSLKILRGHGFKYPSYRRNLMSGVLRKYYDSQLSKTSWSCPVRSKYPELKEN